MPEMQAHWVEQQSEGPDNRRSEEHMHARPSPTSLTTLPPHPQPDPHPDEAQLDPESRAGAWEEAQESTFMHVTHPTHYPAT